jgi:hypothetical protein
MKKLLVITAILFAFTLCKSQDFSYVKPNYKSGKVMCSVIMTGLSVATNDLACGAVSNKAQTQALAGAELAVAIVVIYPLIKPVIKKIFKKNKRKYNYF